MPIPQGDLSLLDTPIARELLAAAIPARLAYTWTDGTPRVVPINFHWNGEELVFGSIPTAPKVKAFRANPHGAVTIDTETFPAKVLLLRGPVTVEVKDGLLPEYRAAQCQYQGDEAGNAWCDNLAQQPGLQMARVALRPNWVGILDFDTRLPSALGGVIG